MSEKYNHIPLLSIVLWSIAGVVGGCTGAALQTLRGRRLTLVLLVAYMMIGVFAALTSGIGAYAFFHQDSRHPDFELHALFFSMVMGFAIPMFLVGVRLISRITISKAGWQADIVFFKSKEPRRRRDDRRVLDIEEDTHL